MNEIGRHEQYCPKRGGAEGQEESGKQRLALMMVTDLKSMVQELLDRRADWKALREFVEAVSHLQLGEFLETIANPRPEVKVLWGASACDLLDNLKCKE